jgi:hypothetical protein
MWLRNYLTSLRDGRGSLRSVLSWLMHGSNPTCQWRWVTAEDFIPARPNDMPQGSHLTNLRVCGDFWWLTEKIAEYNIIFGWATEKDALLYAVIFFCYPLKMFWNFCRPSLMPSKIMWAIKKWPVWLESNSRRRGQLKSGTWIHWRNIIRWRWVPDT